ncbi:ATP-dependent DNA helicase [Pseudohyphozyma bogoriensis]|nr:ATP-dependent DNA helicase [Pseudohyphozyma bogoriensis]
MSGTSEDRSLKRKAASLENSSSGVPEWQPAPGESPAEREKRIKREKRAAMLAGSAGGGAPPAAAGGWGGAGAGGGGAAGGGATASEWQPAPGESPAEREKRIKREKRAAMLGGAGKQAGVSFDLTPQPPSGSGWGTGAGYVPPPAEFDDSTSTSAPGGGVGMGGIHPDRLRAPALLKEVKVKEPKEPKEKTPARKRYLKKKKTKAKAKKASAPLVEPKRLKKSKKDKEREKRKLEGGSDSDDSDESESSVDEEEEAERKAEILKKKAERKVKRDAKKAEIKRLKAEAKEAGEEAPQVPKPKPRVVPTPAKTVVALTPAPAPVEPSAEPTPEELEAIAEEEARLARKEAKRQKRATRREKSASPQPPTTLISTQVDAPMLDDSIQVDETADVEMADDSLPSPPTTNKDEPAPLLRLPTGTRPAPPSAKVLGSLNVHESVRNKRVVHPEKKIAFDDVSLGVSERGRKRLAAMGVNEAFAVQTEVIPILRPPGSSTSLYSPFCPPQDVCVSAPTGSGKTLSYVVPIVETLSTRVVTRLRAIVLLPTRDLVTQVRESFEAFGSGTGLKIGMATGQHSFAHEQSSLVGEDAEGLNGGSSLVDIVIATPGRLMDHIRSTPGFSLQHLRYLVIDEADRLLNQSFNEWLPSILAALKPSASVSDMKVLEPAIADAMAPEWWDAGVGKLESDVYEKSLPSCQKLLFSATLSRDPAKIDALKLHRPIYVSVEDELDGNFDDEGVDDELKFTLPATLQEFMIFSPSSHKPLYLFHLLHTLSLSSALCFTKSVEAATRLHKLVEFFEEERAANGPAGAKSVVVKTYSSDLAPSERTKILNSFKKGEIQMLICSDLISRGIDLPQVSHVISYDIPADMRKYVHRVGRTARAGKSGDAWSLVEDQEAAPFKAIMNAAQHYKKISRVRVQDSAVEPFVPHYQVALEKLRKHFATGREKAQA